MEDEDKDLLYKISRRCIVRASRVGVCRYMQVYVGVCRCM